MGAPLADRLFTLPPDPSNVTGDDVLDGFLDYVREIGLDLYSAQEEALVEILAGKNVILNTPTGSGKSLVATAGIFWARALEQRAFYTCPIKALVSEKFFNLCKEFGPDNVGMMTGDASINREAPIICCTAEVLSNIALREGELADIGFVVIDEFHYYSDRERGVAWQVPILELPQARFLLMSATLGDTAFFETELAQVTGADTVTVKGIVRPVPLEFSYRETPVHETIQDLLQKGCAPIYVVNFTQRSAAEEAQNLMSVDVTTKEDKKRIGEELSGIRFSSPFGKDFQRLVRHGIGIHHAGLLPKYRLVVEKLAQMGLLKVICGTDTLGVGVNVPIRSVLFTKLCKYDGEKTAILSVRDFHQIAGRAGRKGFDESGWVVAQAPEHVIENLRLEAKAGNDPTKRKKIVRKKPPEKGYVPWDKATFDKLVSGTPEQLVSRFEVNHGMLLNVLQREGGGCMAMARLLSRCHERPTKKRQMGRAAFQIYQSLIDNGIIERTENGIALHVDLQEDFSLHHALSLYLLEAIEGIDRTSETYALDVLTLVESIQENPDVLLQRQLDKMKTELMAQMKAQGVEYEERIERLEQLEYPKPNKEFIYTTFNDFAKRHPWIVGDNIRPKAIARDMFEQYLSFPEYIREYGLERVEGLLLRYLSETYKTLLQTVPAHARDERVDELITYFGTMVRAVDSSLLDEWERLKQGDRSPTRAELVKEIDRADITSDEKAFTVLVRNASFALIRALANGDWERFVESFDETKRPSQRDIVTTMDAFWKEHSTIRTDTAARNPELMNIVKESGQWRVRQVILDAEGDHDWYVEIIISLETSALVGKPVLQLVQIAN